MSSADTLARPVPTARRTPSTRLLRSELRLVFGRRRNQILLLVLALVPVLVGVAIRVSTGEAEPGEGPPFLDRVSGNGLFLSFTGLATVVPFFLPLTVGVVSGDAVAGEAQAGTLDELSLLARPSVFVETPDRDAALAVLRRLGASSVTADPDGLRVRADLPDVAVEQVTRALVHADVPVRAIGRSGRSLEDLFVELTGEGFDVVG